MTNIIAQATNTVTVAVQAEPSFLTKYGSEILTAIITAAILGVGTILWSYFGQPFLTGILKRRDERRRRDEIVTSFNQLKCSSGTDCIRNKHFVAIELPNNTSQPVVVREVRLVQDGRPIYGMWHNPKYDLPSGDRTEIVQTGVRISPRSHGTWYFTGPEFTSEQCPQVLKCQIEFEYSIDGHDVHEHSMRSPDAKDKNLYFMFELWWKAVGRDIREKKNQHGTGG
jgi:hypothetical protein